MPERARYERARAERSAARAAGAGAYAELARSEARRLEALAGAVEAAETWRAAAAALGRAEHKLGDRVVRLLAAGMTVADLAAALDVERAVVRRVARLAGSGDAAGAG